LSGIAVLCLCDVRKERLPSQAIRSLPSPVDPYSGELDNFASSFPGRGGLLFVLFAPVGDRSEFVAVHGASSPRGMLFKIKKPTSAS